MSRRTPPFAPVLRYLVQVADGIYSHPDMPGFHAGQEVWADAFMQFHLHGDALAHASTLRHGRVVKLRVSAEREPVRRINRPALEDVPRDGGTAMMQGWGVRSCPHPPATATAMRWISDWWRASADALEGDVS